MRFKPLYRETILRDTIDELQRMLNWVKQRMDAHESDPRKYMKIEEVQALADTLVKISRAIGRLHQYDQRYEEMKTLVDDILKRTDEMQEENKELRRELDLLRSRQGEKKWG